MTIPSRNSQRYQENISAITNIGANSCNVFVANLADFSAFDYLEVISPKAFVWVDNHAETIQFVNLVIESICNTPELSAFLQLITKIKAEPFATEYAYNEGWLSSQAKYNLVRDLVYKIPSELYHAQGMGVEGLENIPAQGINIYYHTEASQISAPEYGNVLKCCYEVVANYDRQILLLSNCREPVLISSSPTDQLKAKISKDVEDGIVEIIGDGKQGFSDLNIPRLGIKEFYENNTAINAVLLSDLLASGVPRKDFVKILRSLIADNKKIIVVEGNPNSKDFNNQNISHYASGIELIELIRECAGEMAYEVLGSRLFGNSGDVRSNIYFLQPTAVSANNPRLIRPIYQRKKTINVCIIYDEPGWAWWYRAHQIKWNIDPIINIDVRKNDDPINHEYYDYIVCFESYVFKHTMVYQRFPRAKIILGSSNLMMLETSVQTYLEMDCRAFVVNNRESYTRYPQLHDIYCCQNGVDTELFSYCFPRGDAVSACWVGNPSSCAQKGLDLIIAACKLANVPLHFYQHDACKRMNVDTERLSQSALRDNLYHRSTFYICASEGEGTPNPALESLACGLPVISTRVGNMPELIIDGYNGFLVDRNVEAIAGAIAKLRCLDLQTISLNARASVENGWQWKDQVKKYQAMFLKLAEEDNILLKRSIKRT